MILTIDDRRQAFRHWLRTGLLPTVRDTDGVERKFNPWHDPADGRFTFAGAGQHYADGHASSSNAHAPRRLAGTTSRHRPDPTKDAQRLAGARARVGKARHPRPAATHMDRGPLNPVTEFVRGAGQGVYQAATEAAEGLYSALTTDPRTTARNAVSGVAAAIDGAIAAEDTPARVQVARAVNAAKAASARDVGRAFGSVGTNVGLTVVPGAATSRISAVRYARKVGPRPNFPVIQSGQIKETLGRSPMDPVRTYNDGATGAQPGLAPALKRTMPDGTSRWVKFDGIDGDYMIDRKWSIVDRPHARAQAFRQSAALREQSLIGIWEVPNELQFKKAKVFLNKLGIRNIKVRIVKP